MYVRILQLLNATERRESVSSNPVYIGPRYISENILLLFELLLHILLCCSTRHSNYWLLIRPVCHKIIEITSVTRAYLIVSRKTTVVMWLFSYICLSLELSLNMLSGKEDTPRLNSLIVTNFFKPWNASGWIVKFCPAFGKYCIRLKTLNILVIP